jgi:hypothetical protein
MKRNAWKLGTLTATITLISGLLSGCAWSIGENKGHTLPTKGQELMDLKRAKDTGAMTEEEYQTQKQKILGK